MIVLANAVFATSPLTGQSGPTIGQVDAIAALFRDPRVQRAAGEARAAILRVAEFAAFRSLISAAIGAAGNDPSAERVADALRGLGEQAEAALVDTRSDQAEHDRIVRARRDQLQPLRTAVSERLNRLQTGLKSLTQQADALRRAPPPQVTAPEVRKQLLQQAGLTGEQIAALSAGGTGPSREEQREQINVRIIEIRAAMQPLQKFAETGNESVLAGMAEFEPLIAARHAAEASE